MNHWGSMVPVLTVYERVEANEEYGILAFKDDSVFFLLKESNKDNFILGFISQLSEMR